MAELNEQLHVEGVEDDDDNEAPQQVPCCQLRDEPVDSSPCLLTNLLLSLSTGRASRCYDLPSVSALRMSLH